MKILFIGGTGTISMAITKLLAQQGHEVILLNRGGRSSELPDSVKVIKCDIYSDSGRLTRARTEVVKYNSGDASYPEHDLEVRIASSSPGPGTYTGTIYFSIGVNHN